MESEGAEGAKQGGTCGITMEQHTVSGRSPLAQYDPYNTLSVGVIYPEHPKPRLERDDVWARRVRKQDGYIAQHAVSASNTIA